jgi:phosphohistidine phosphatase
VKVYVMRHGPAEDQSESGRDFDRKLTTSGRVRTELAAHELGRWERPKNVVTSPLTRTVETSEIVVGVLGVVSSPEVRDELAPGGDAIKLLAELAGQGAKRVLLVGHEPDVSALTSYLVPGWSRGFDKAMIVGLKVDRSAMTERTSNVVLAKLRFVIDVKRLHN